MMVAALGVSAFGQPFGVPESGPIGPPCRALLGREGLRIHWGRFAGVSSYSQRLAGGLLSRASLPFFSGCEQFAIFLLHRGIAVVGREIGIHRVFDLGNAGI